MHHFILKFYASSQYGTRSHNIGTSQGRHPCQMSCARELLMKPTAERNIEHRAEAAKQFLDLLNYRDFTFCEKIQFECV